MPAVAGLTVPAGIQCDLPSQQLPHTGHKSYERPKRLLDQQRVYHVQVVRLKRVIGLAQFQTTQQHVVACLVQFGLGAEQRSLGGEHIKVDTHANLRNPGSSRVHGGARRLHQKAAAALFFLFRKLINTGQHQTRHGETAHPPPPTRHPHATREVGVRLMLRHPAWRSMLYSVGVGMSPVADISLSSNAAFSAQMV